MKKVILFLGLQLFFTCSALADTFCFLAKENDNLLREEGTDCKTRYAPESTFKIPLSVMGYDAKILRDETHPEWPFKEEYELYVNTWKGPHNPHSWMRDSCVWYSQVLTQHLGMPKFKNYAESFAYGNQDVSGDVGANNGLTHSWLSSSLQISPEEQTEFLQKFVDKKLSVSPKAYTITKKLIFIQELAGGWKLYGKTGNGRQQDSDGKKLELRHGWFVGFIEKNGRTITFATHLTDAKKYDTFASFRARNEALIKLWYLIDELEK